MYTRYLFLLMFFLSLKGFAQVPLKTTADQEDALVLSYNTTHSIDVVVAHFSLPQSLSLEDSAS